MLRERIIEHAVDREIAPLGIFLGRAENDAARMPAVEIFGIASKRGHFHLPSPGMPNHSDHAEGGPDCQGMSPAEKAANLVGLGVRGNVVIPRRMAENLIPHAAAGPIGDKPVGPQPLDHLDGKLPLHVKIVVGHGVSIVDQGSGVRGQVSGAASRRPFRIRDKGPKPYQPLLELSPDPWPLTPDPWPLIPGPSPLSPVLAVSRDFRFSRSEIFDSPLRSR